MLLSTTLDFLLHSMYFNKRVARRKLSRLIFWWQGYFIGKPTALNTLWDGLTTAAPLTLTKQRTTWSECSLFRDMTFLHFSNVKSCGECQREGQMSYLHETGHQMLVLPRHLVWRHIAGRQRGLADRTLFLHRLYQELFPMCFVLNGLVPPCTKEISCLLLVSKWSLAMRQNNIQIFLPLAQEFWHVDLFCLSCSPLGITVWFCNRWGWFHVWDKILAAASCRSNSTIFRGCCQHLLACSSRIWDRD